MYIYIHIYIYTHIYIYIDSNSIQEQILMQEYNYQFFRVLMMRNILYYKW